MVSSSVVSTHRQVLACCIRDTTAQFSKAVLANLGTMSVNTTVLDAGIATCKLMRIDYWPFEVCDYDVAPLECYGNDSNPSVR
jgi:hypothetical protein